MVRLEKPGKPQRQVASAMQEIDDDDRIVALDVKRVEAVILPLSFRTEVHGAQKPAKKASGWDSSKANHTGGRDPSGWVSLGQASRDHCGNTIAAPS